MHADPETLNNFNVNSKTTSNTDSDTFKLRHIGVAESDIRNMLSSIGASDLEQLIDETIPSCIRLDSDLKLPLPMSEEEALSYAKTIAERNETYRSFIGQGYYGTCTPKVILRNIFENPSWYTQYTPYQAEIAQGRLEALLNFQTMVCDLTGMEIANSSLLDEGTALAEAMTMAWRVKKLVKDPVFAVHSGIHPQSMEVLRTRAEPLGIRLLPVENPLQLDEIPQITGVIIQTPSTDGAVIDLSQWSVQTHAKNAFMIVASDLLSMCMIESPGSKGADVVVGNAQRFGVPPGYGGPHAAFMACKSLFQREMPGRIVGVSKDSHGHTAYRLALQTREQHIKRERATSNICTAQVLLAIMSGMYAVYHGPEGLKRIARTVSRMTAALAGILRAKGVTLMHDCFFDTLRTAILTDLESVKKRSEERKLNLRYYSDNSIGISLDERTSEDDLIDLVYVISGETVTKDEIGGLKAPCAIPEALARSDDFLSHDVFSQYHSETEMLRYIKRLEGRDLSLTHSMIPLGSCTMKLNATSEMIPVSWEEFSSIHPFVPPGQVQGYEKICDELSDFIAEITGFPAVSLQPNAGSQGEYAGLLVIRNFLLSKGEKARNVCLIPSSAHGTNPATAHMAGMKVVVVACDSAGNIDLDDLQARIDAHKNEIAALMVTYPSTHGVFEEEIIRITSMVHEAGGYVYMDGANLNAQVGLCKASAIGADVCHLNLHKTFCIPHGGGGPGMGPIACIEEFRPYLPGHEVTSLKGSGAVSAAPYGSASILLISWMYIRMMGSEGLTEATKIAILNANYIACRLSEHYRVLYKGAHGRVAHECIIDLRHLKRTSGIDVTDIAKRLMDYGFHAPTVSFPVPETMMIEPTESESLSELDRFCDAMISIAGEILEVEKGHVKPEDSPLKHAPHTVDSLVSENWGRVYSREKAVYPLPWVRERKFWPPVGRIDNAFGDRNLFCQCVPVSEYN
jgi:glycine dehydrogenase